MRQEAEVKPSLYDTDYQLWLEHTLEQLRSHDFNQIDLENLIEELEDLGKSNKRAMSTLLMRLCEHLLKLKYWDIERAACFRGWDAEVANFRIQIQALIEDSPSLKNYLNQNFTSAYRNGRKLFLKTSGLDTTLVPEHPCFTLEQALDEDWLPWQP